MLLRKSVCCSPGPGLFLVLVLLAGCSSRVEPPPPEKVRDPQPGLVSRTLDIMRGSPDRINRAGLPNVRRLVVKAVVNPDPIRISARKFDVTFALRNNDKKQAVNLRFNTSQRIEVALVNSMGKVVDRWSDDHAFAQASGYLVINPSEEAAYTVSMSTRELAAGQTYRLEAYFVGYEQLADVIRVTPVP